jgi:hypothetical protein
MSRGLAGLIGSDLKEHDLSERLRWFAAHLRANMQEGVSLVCGDYALVPHSCDAQPTPCPQLELQRGYLMSENAPGNSPIFDLATNLKPDITYLSANINLKPLPQPPSSLSSGSTKRNGQK